MRVRRVLVGFEFSARVRDAFLVRGYDAYSCDLRPTESPHGDLGRHYQCDILEVLDLGWDLGIFHPTCTHHVVSGARWFHETPKRPRPGVFYEAERYAARERDRALIRRVWECGIPMVAIENPVGTLGDVIGKPTQIVQPFHFGDPFRKTTCLWLRGLPKLTRTSDLQDGAQECWLEPPGPGREKKRSLTYPGMAAAFASQWGALLVEKAA
jgi:hypothetical protein